MKDISCRFITASQYIKFCGVSGFFYIHFGNMKTKHSRTHFALILLNNSKIADYILYLIIS